MRKLTYLAIMSAVLVSFSGVGHADSKLWGRWWWPNHWVNQDFQPHYDNAKDPQNSQWKEDGWTPQEWIKSVGGDGTKLVETWLNNRVLTGSSKDSDGISVLEVGPNFYHLSEKDKRRVMATLDAIYQVTAQTPRMFFIKDSSTHKVIGTYSREGLVLQ